MHDFEEYHMYQNNCSYTSVLIYFLGERVLNMATMQNNATESYPSQVILTGKKSRSQAVLYKADLSLQKLCSTSWLKLT